MSCRKRPDPRHLQIAILLGLLVCGQLALGFEIDPATAFLIVASALLLQALLGRAIDATPFEPRSALITALSLCLLLRTSDPWLGIAASSLAIGSKFLLRRHGRHLWNPSAFALVALVLISDRAWVSPGQWGSAALLGFAVAGFGALVVTRAERADVTLTFLLSWAGLLLARAFWLGDPLAIPAHQLQAGSLLVFAFFMISDPRSTPASRPGRILFAALVAAGGFGGRFLFYEPDALLFALVAAAPLVPFLDGRFPGRAYRWADSDSSTERQIRSGGSTHETKRSVPAAPGRPALAG